MNNINDEIVKAANTALTDHSVESDELLQPKLIINEIENELKTLSIMRSSCLHSLLNETQ